MIMMLKEKNVIEAIQYDWHICISDGAINKVLLKSYSVNNGEMPGRPVQVQTNKENVETFVEYLMG